jgi:hypothetical protein
VKTLIPYEAEITAQTPGWLETPKIFTRGYRAVVDGKETPVARSPQGLVMVPVEEGDHQVVLSYPGPWSLRVAFWTSVVAWLVVFAFVVMQGQWRERWRAQRAAILMQVGKMGAVACAAALVFKSLSYLLTLPAPPAELAASEHFNLQLSLPVDREKGTEVIASTRIQERDIALFARYVSGQHVVFGFLRDGAPWMTSAPVPINYVLSHALDVTWSGSKDMTQAKAHRFRLVLDHRVLIDRMVGLENRADPRSGKIDATAATPFSGRLHAAEPLPSSASGAVPAKEYVPVAGTL